MGFEPSTFCMASRMWNLELPKKVLQNMGFRADMVSEASQVSPRNQGSFRTETGLWDVSTLRATALASDGVTADRQSSLS